MDPQMIYNTTIFYRLTPCTCFWHMEKISLKSFESSSVMLLIDTPPTPTLRPPQPASPLPLKKNENIRKLLYADTQHHNHMIASCDLLYSNFKFLYVIHL